MDVAGPSDVQISKKRTRATTVTGEAAEIASTLGALATWGGATAATLTEAAEDAFTICSSCQSLLIRPACDPKRGGFLAKEAFIVHRSLSALSSSALCGCIVCKLAIAAKPTPRHCPGISSIDGFLLALYWDDHRRNFLWIAVEPVNHFNERLASRTLNLIRLVSEDGISLGLYS
jgi:hypothetical protein